MFIYLALNLGFEKFWWEFLAVLWLELSTLIAGAQVPSLVRELRPRKLWDFQLILFHDHLYLFHLSQFGFHNFKTLIVISFSDSSIICISYGNHGVISYLYG